MVEGDRDEARRQHEESMQKLRVEAKASEERIVAEQDGALLRYHGVVRSIRGIIKASEERHAGHANKFTPLQLLLEGGRKAKAVASSSGPSLKELRVAELESALEAKQLEMQMLPAPASKNLTLRAGVSRLRASVEMLGCKRREIAMLTETVRDLRFHLTKIRTEVENVRNWNM